MMDWTPVTWSTIQGGRLKFQGIQKGDVAILATFENNQLITQSPPFHIICPTGEIHFYDTDGKFQDVVLLSKTNLQGETEDRNRMKGGVFEASNTVNFEQKDTLHYVKSAPSRLLTNVPLENQNQYRYVRYYGPDSSHCNIAEIEFYESPIDSFPLKGKIIGTSGVRENSPNRDYTVAFDSKTTTSFDYKEPSGGWVGLDLGEPKQISKIVYTPKNKDNYVRSGDEYELFYRGKTWISLGKVISDTDSLIYTNVPSNRFLYLKNHTGGVEERIFTYENGKQIWW